MPYSNLVPQEIVSTLSTVSRGSDKEKLEWTFRLYDVDEDGLVNFNDIRKLVSSIYELMGDNTEPPSDPFIVNEKAKDLFVVSMFFLFDQI